MRSPHLFNYTIHGPNTSLPSLSHGPWRLYLIILSRREYRLTDSSHFTSVPVVQPWRQPLRQSTQYTRCIRTFQTLLCAFKYLGFAWAVGFSQQPYEPLSPRRRFRLWQSHRMASFSSTPQRRRRFTASSCITTRKSFPFSRNSSDTPTFTRCLLFCLPIINALCFSISLANSWDTKCAGLELLIN